MPKVKIAIHQPNFMPWFPYFCKMAYADIFVVLTKVQFEKNGFQNRFKYRGNWVTKPVINKIETIEAKQYIDKHSVSFLNTQLIRAFASMLSIDTRIVEDKNITIESQDATGKIVDILESFNYYDDGIAYVTNPEAKDKYLDEEKIKAAGFDIEYFKTPKHLQASTWEIIERYGLEGAMRQLPRREEHEVPCVR